MEINKDYFIIGLPIETEFGSIRFLTFQEQIEHQNALALISFNVLHFYYQFKKMDKKDNPMYTEAVEKIKESELIEVVFAQEEILHAYTTIIDLVFSTSENKKVNIESIAKKIFESNDSFLRFRKIVLDMNLITEKKVSPNPEIQKRYEQSERVNSRNSDGIGYADMLTSIFVVTGVDYEKLAKMTVFQIKATFSRLAQIKTHEYTTRMFEFLEKKEIVPWESHIDLFKEEETGIDRDKFVKQFNEMV